MEDDTVRKSGPEHRQDHLRVESVHDDPDLDVTHRRRSQTKYVHDAAVGRPGYHPCGRASNQRDLHRDHVLRQSCYRNRHSVACHRQRCFRDLLVSVAGGLQLLPAAEVQQAEQQDRSLRQAVHLPADLKRAAAGGSRDKNDLKRASFPRRLTDENGPIASQWGRLMFDRRNHTKARGTAASRRQEDPSDTAESCLVTQR